MLRFTCPTCRNQLSAPEEKAGINVICRFCKTQLQIPKQVSPSHLPIFIAGGIGVIFLVCCGGIGLVAMAVNRKAEPIVVRSDPTQDPTPKAKTKNSKQAPTTISKDKTTPPPNDKNKEKKPPSLPPNKDKNAEPLDNPAKQPDNKKTATDEIYVVVAKNVLRRKIPIGLLSPNELHGQMWDAFRQEMYENNAFTQGKDLDRNETESIIKQYQDTFVPEEKTKKMDDGTQALGLRYGKRVVFIFLRNINTKEWAWAAATIDGKTYIPSERGGIILK